MTNAFHRKNFYKRFSTEIVKYIFVQSNENRYLRNKSSFRRPPIKTVYHGSESVSYLGPKMWDNVTRKLKEASSIDSSKKSVRKKIPKTTPADCANHT